jgi:hypothetical protein
MSLSIYKTAYKRLSWKQKELDDAFELLESDQVACAMPNYGGWLTIEVELEDADWIGERDNAIEIMLELNLINEEESSELYQKEEIKQIIFAI